MHYVKTEFNRGSSRGGLGSDPLGRLGKPICGPQLGVNTLIIIVAMYFTFFLNSAFFAEVIAKSGADGAARALLVISTGAILTALNVLILGLLCVRWTVKPVLALLLVVSATAAYYSDNYSVYFDASMVRNVLKTDGAEAGELLTWGFFLAVLIKGVVPAIAVLTCPHQPYQ